MRQLHMELAQGSTFRCIPNLPIVQGNSGRYTVLVFAVVAVIFTTAFTAAGLFAREFLSREADCLDFINVCALHDLITP